MGGTPVQLYRLEFRGRWNPFGHSETDPLDVFVLVTDGDHICAAIAYKNNDGVPIWRDAEMIPLEWTPVWWTDFPSLPTKIEPSPNGYSVGEVHEDDSGYQCFIQSGDGLELEWTLHYDGWNAQVYTEDEEWLTLYVTGEHSFPSESELDEAWETFLEWQTSQDEEE